MPRKFRNLCLALCLMSIALSNWADAQQQPHPGSQTGVTEQPGLITYLQGMGLDVDQNTVIMACVGTALIAVGAMGLDALFIIFLLFGRPMMHQIMAQMNNGPPGSNPMEGMAAAYGNTLKNLFSGQDMAAIMSKIISTMLPTLLKATSQFVTDQANPQQG